MKDQKQELVASGKSLQSNSRRRLIKTSIALCALGSVMTYAPIKPVFAAGGAPAALPARVAAFQKLSQFLTSKSVDATLAQRYYDALKKRNPELDSSIASLNELVNTRKLGHMDNYLALQDVDRGLDACARTIVKSMYLGVVGDDDKAELIAYREAFMYK
ncbi:MAG TPA: sugar dehydrogenase complex small subunit, partial [Paraburkholderia sp.]|uniref:sugar dehydrogenase complex small subunit n=1 Tax=Paraburkholderia sp. TaxID=1926495 RepID=UPI002B468587